MATIYWAGAKAPKEEAVKALMKELAEWTDNRYYARFERRNHQTNSWAGGS